MHPICKPFSTTFETNGACGGSNGQFRTYEGTFCSHITTLCFRVSDMAGVMWPFYSSPF